MESSVKKAEAFSNRVAASQTNSLQNLVKELNLFKSTLENHPDNLKVQEKSRDKVLRAAEKTVQSGDLTKTDQENLEQILNGQIEVPDIDSLDVTIKKYENQNPGSTIQCDSSKRTSDLKKNFSEKEIASLFENLQSTKKQINKASVRQKVSRSKKLNPKTTTAITNLNDALNNKSTQEILISKGFNVDEINALKTKIDKAIEEGDLTSITKECSNLMQALDPKKAKGITGKLNSKLVELLQVNKAVEATKPKTGAKPGWLHNSLLFLQEKLLDGVIAILISTITYLLIHLNPNLGNTIKDLKDLPDNIGKNIVEQITDETKKEAIKVKKQEVKFNLDTKTHNIYQYNKDFLDDLSQVIKKSKLKELNHSDSPKDALLKEAQKQGLKNFRIINLRNYNRNSSNHGLKVSLLISNGRVTVSSNREVNLEDLYANDLLHEGLVRCSPNSPIPKSVQGDKNFIQRLINSIKIASNNVPTTDN